MGTRGGFGDQAAIKFGKLDSILHVNVFPITVKAVPFPDSYKIVLANSLVEAKKQAGARNIFNDHVASYIFGLMLIRKNFPQYAEKLERFRDINPERLGVDDARIYRIVKSLPKCVSRADILRLLPGQEEEIRHIFRSHDEPEGGYKIRQICLYGIAECIRGEMAPKYLETGDMKTFGELINISHDGDRVTKVVDGKRVSTDNSYPDSKLDALIDDLESGDRDRVEQARLWRQSGGYDVSVAEMDMLVDIALSIEGVVGAGLVGAGMGGSVVAVVEEKYAQQLIDNMAEQYYLPNKLPVEAEIVRPVGGLCTINV